MAEGGDEGEEKTHDPTQQKIQKAREQGDIAKSQDLNIFALYIGCLIVIYGMGKWSINYLGEHLQLFYNNAHSLLMANSKPALADSLGNLIIHIFLGLSPLLIVMLVLPVMSLIMQQAIVFSVEKIQFKLSRISLIAGFKNKFSKEALVEFFKSNVKICLVSFALWIIAKPILQAAPSMIQTSERLMVLMMGHILTKVMIAATVIAGIIGILDFLWQKFLHIEKLRMTLTEIKDEHKNNEGDPHLKMKRRERGKEIALSKTLAQVPNADVVIMNPTHYAVALKWSQQKGTAPICIAKGVDSVALAMRKKAEECKVPIQQDPPLARALYATVEVDDEVREEHYKAVAAAIKFAMEIRRKQNALEGI
jgi:flagellar biosynthetic protein FlhB